MFFLNLNNNNKIKTLIKPRIQLSAPPKDGEANTECVKYMAEVIYIVYKIYN